MKIREAAEKLGVSQMTVLTAIKRGYIKAKKSLKLKNFFYDIPEEEVKRLLEMKEKLQKNGTNETNIMLKV